MWKVTFSLRFQLREAFSRQFPNSDTLSILMYYAFKVSGSTIGFHEGEHTRPVSKC